MLYSHKVPPMTYIQTLLSIDHNDKTFKMKHPLIDGLTNIKSKYTTDSKFVLRFADKTVIECIDKDAYEGKNIFLTLLDSLGPCITDLIPDSHLRYFMHKFNSNNNLYTFNRDTNQIAFLLNQVSNKSIVRKMLSHESYSETEDVIMLTEEFESQYSKYVLHHARSEATTIVN